MEERSSVCHDSFIMTDDALVTVAHYHQRSHHVECRLPEVKCMNTELFATLTSYCFEFFGNLGKQGKFLRGTEHCLGNFPLLVGFLLWLFDPTTGNYSIVMKFSFTIVVQSYHSISV